jgi:hypothetical protein
VLISVNLRQILGFPITRFKPIPPRLRASAVKFPLFPDPRSSALIRGKRSGFPITDAL